MEARHGAFFADNDDKTRLYQLGQWFNRTDPGSSTVDAVKTAFTQFKQTRTSQSVSKQRLALFGIANYSIADKKDKFTMTSYLQSEIRVAFGYPLQWILQCNHAKPRHSQRQFLNASDSQREYRRPKQPSAKEICASDGTLLFQHQRFVEYCLRPYSPIRSLVINSRTGSGKTRMMQAVLENFACFPNRKIVLFPNQTLRETFYNKAVCRFSKFYTLDCDKPIRRRIAAYPNGDEYEALDAFNLQYAENGSHCSVNGRYDHPLFEEFYALVEAGKPMGATIVLTYEEFFDLSQNPNMRGSDYFYTDGKFDIKGAMVLVDKAHLLFDTDAADTYNRNIAESIRTILEDETQLHTIGLFTATPFEDLNDIVRYQALLGTTLTDPKEIASNYMMSYSPGKVTDMFNTETKMFIEVPESTHLTRRAKETGLDVDRLSKHCWFTEFDRQGAPDWEKIDYKSNLPELDKRSILDQYDYLMSQEYSGTNPKSMDLLKEVYPKMARVFDRVLIHTTTRSRRLEFWKYCQDHWNRQKATPRLWDSQGPITKAHQLGLKTDVGIMYPKHHTSAANSREEWEEYVSRQLLDTRQDRSVVMIDIDHGLIELSRLLTRATIPHVILQIENSSSRQTGDVEQIQLCGAGGLSTSELQRAAGGTTFMDDGLTKFVNMHVDEIPVVLFNSYVPEGISLFDVRNMHVVSMTDSFTNISQMIGRINRMCRPTQQDKCLYMYVYKGSREKFKYCNEENTRKRWPHLNLVE